MTVTIKNRYTVKPAEETPIMKLSISESDQINPVTHAPTIYIYKLTGTAADECPFPAAVEALKTSLSKVLVSFYPLAGRLNWLPGGRSRLEIDCNAMGAEILEAESELCIDDYGDFMPTPQLRELIPVVDYINIPIHEIPLIIVQITHFRCGGRSIGFANSHILLDGAAALHFISEWARVARGLEISQRPYLDRTKPWNVPNDHHDEPQQQCEEFPQQKFHHPEFNPLPLLIGSENNSEEKAKPTEVSLLKLTKAQIENIKNKANGDENLKRPYSRYEAITAHIWKTASKSRNHKPDQPTNVRVTVDVRRRIDPPLPEGYFGNAVFPTMATSNAGDLVQKPLSYAASRIRESISKITNEYIRSAMSFAATREDMNKIRVSHTLRCSQATFFGNPNMGITSWINLPLYGADFGWGKEMFMGPGALFYDGNFFILPSREGDGGLVVVFRMQVEHLESFSKFFYEEELV